MRMGKNSKSWMSIGNGSSVCLEANTHTRRHWTILLMTSILTIVFGV
jgi:hypothetical protein